MSPSPSASPAACPECGAPLDEWATCGDYLHEMLVLESRIPGGPGEEPHFLAVASYNLQHPGSFVPAALVGLRHTLADVVTGRATVADARRRARAGADGATRVRRHADTVLTAEDRAMLDAWPTAWPLTVRDVCRVAPAAYAPAVRAWAAAVVATLAAVPPRDG